MIRNYFKTAVRNLLRHRFFSIINIFGLSLAMSICMGMIMLIADQLQYDQYNSKKDRVYRVNSLHTNDKLEPREDATINSTSPMALKEELEKYASIDKIVRFHRGFGNAWIEFENNDVNVPVAGYYADPGALEMFEYELQYGDAATALRDPYSVVLTRKAADKLFSDENPLGKTFKVGDLGLYTVTGVLAETERKTHIAFEALASMSSLLSLDAQGKQDAHTSDWNDFWNTWTYVTVKEGADRADVNKSLDQIFDAKIATNPRTDAIKMRLTLQSLTEITPGPFVNNPIGPSLPWLFVYILGGLSGVIMIVSCFNFTNLSIARSLTRAREIGVRKVNGASRIQIFGQFISEAVIVALCSLLFSLALLMLVKPLILQLNFARIFRWDLASNFQVYAVFVAFALLVGILAGMFPAIVLSGFKPVKVLKSVGNMKLFSRMGLRKALLVSQFTLALVFILSVSVLYNQLDLFLHKDHGFDMQNQLSVKLNKTPVGPLKTELLKNGNIISVSAASHLPAAGRQEANGFRKPGEKDWVTVYRYMADEDYLDNLNLKLVAGKFFDKSAVETNKNYVVINEAAVKKLNYPSPLDAVGNQIVDQGDSSVLTIVGVVLDYNHQALLNNIEPLAVTYTPDRFEIAQVKYSGTYESAMQTVTEAWAKVNPEVKIDAKDMQSEVMLLYNTLFGDAVSVLGFIAFLAIVISCLGLLGMATYATETRIKEVSIRKVLGSTNSSLVYLLSKGFLVIILIAIAIGVPIAYFLNTAWLELLPYHVTMNIPVIAFGVAMLILFAVVTVGSQTYRATFVNPVDNLKNE
jgi:putative ABC transport system permease protein